MQSTATTATKNGQCITLKLYIQCIAFLSPPTDDKTIVKVACLPHNTPIICKDVHTRISAVVTFMIRPQKIQLSGEYYLDCRCIAGLYRLFGSVFLSLSIIEDTLQIQLLFHVIGLSHLHRRVCRCTDKTLQSSPQRQDSSENEEHELTEKPGGMGENN